MTGLGAPYMLAGTLAVAICAPAAQAQVATKYVDLTLGAGFSTNPFLRSEDADGSLFGRASARGVHSWKAERSLTSLMGYVEGTSYLNDYGLKTVFSVDGSHLRQVSETMTVFGSVGASGDIAGQLGNRFLYVPAEVETPGDVPPLPLAAGDLDRFAYGGRQYRFYGQAGLSARLTERSSVTVSGGASRYTFTQDALTDFTTLFATASYNRILSERTTLGFNLHGSRSDYDGSRDYNSVLNPSVSVSTRLSENLHATAGVGIALSKVRAAMDSDTSTDLSLNGSLCRTGPTESLCAEVARNAQSTATAPSVTMTSASAEWYKKLDEKQTIQLSAGYIKYGAAGDDLLAQSLGTSQLRGAASYSRSIIDRLSLGADAGIRSFRRAGDDPSADVSGSLFVRYRLGDLR